ncbi:hypothetical protein SAMN04487833_1461 [Sarcina sp. DSM 11001]|uniref:hypothetical protein n=1 Tax=Sarcina sp. DSM 11001 TaxID=1798184 RepID=UPI00087F35EC|nr:hypothetical protein [Sarcina sp. DSM 11001]SDL98370.1 hypothetical protein SAMN04487833_1461 [Sarcina sp. DSM 11001]
MKNITKKNITKKNMTRTAAILLAAMLTTGLCACGNGTTSVSKDSGQTVEQTGADTDPGETEEVDKPAAAGVAVSPAAAETADDSTAEKENNISGSTPSEKTDGDSSSAGTPPEGSTGGTPPEKPDGNGGSGGTPPEGGTPPGGSTPPEGGIGGTPPEKPDGNGGPGGTPLKAAPLLEAAPPLKAVPEEPPPEKPDGNGGPGGAPGRAPGGSSTDINYSGAVEISSADTQSGQIYDSSASDENALLISTSDDVTITDPTVTKTGDSDGGDSCNFYGLNAAVLVKDGAQTTITGGTITSDADGANGVFSYGGNGGRNGAEGDGTSVTIRDTTITTTGSGSGGIMTTGGGTTYAYNLDVTTSGQSSAAIRTDRGGGTVVVDGGTYTSNGLGSPAIYSTADITVSNAALTSNLSEGVCIEGLNSITLNNCELAADNTKCNGNATFLDSIMIYQSMSGDADSGTSHFTMTGGSLTSKSGHVFHVTNTNAVITLEGVDILNEDTENILLSVCADGWSGGSNVAALKAAAQKLDGAVKVGSDSSLTLELTDGSTFEGYIDGNITNAKGGTVSTEAGEVSVTLDDSSTWTLTGDSYVTEFNGNAANVISNGYTLYVNGTALTEAQ